MQYINCIFCFAIGFFLGFVTALALIIGITIIPVILGIILVVSLYLWFKSGRRKDNAF